MLKNKIIHQTWKTRKLPEEYADYSESVKRNNPNYDFRLWTDNDNRELIAQQYPWFLPTYDSYTHNIERVDAVRYFILYTFGGVYIDLDMECLKPIDSLFKTGEIFFSLEAGPLITNAVLSNAFMAANQGNSFFYKVITQLESIKSQDITFNDVFNNTGPDMLSRQYSLNRGQYDFRIISLNSICPKKVIIQHPKLKHLTLDEIRQQKQLYLIHHNTESWNIQAQCPDIELEGYHLFKCHDINGYDIDYIEYVDNNHDDIIKACNQNPKAIGFNYNGYIKGIGGTLEKIEGRNFWLKEGIEPWICIKTEKLHLVRQNL